MIKLSSTEKQVFMVAKHHYKHLINDSNRNEFVGFDIMRAVFLKLFEIDSMSDFDVYLIVCDVFNKHTTDIQRNDALRHAFLFGCPLKETVSYKELTLWMLGAIAVIAIFKNGEQLFDMEEEKLDVTLEKSPINKPPSNCPECNGEREWSGIGKLAICHFCGKES